MPPSACAALASTCSLMRLMPCTSVTEYIMQMSLGPTYGRVSPLAMVETITFGQPIGSARMPAVASEVPPEPPALMMPPRSRRVRTNCSKACAMAVTARPRSPLNTAASPPDGGAPLRAGARWRATACPLVDRSTVTTRKPSFSRHWRRKNSSRALVSKVPAT
jgi:hypothetical protein